MRVLKRLPGMPTQGGDRHASWLEVFFDLVFILAISELANYLHDHLTLSGCLAFLGLFVVVWWTWLGFTFFADQFDPSHLTYRLVMLLVMLGSIMLAVNIQGALDEHASAFILLNTALQAILAALYLWGSQNKAAHTLAIRFAIGFAISTLFWLISLWLPSPLRYLFWTFALLIEIGTPLLVALRLKTRPFYVSHIPERLGLFTIIVLGESIIRIGTGLVDTHWQPDSLISAIASFVIAACLWWLYFDRIDAEVMSRALAEGGGRKRELIRSFSWSYAHVILFAGLAATSVGITLVIEEAGRTLLTTTSLTLGIGSAATLLAITLIQQVGPQSLSAKELTGRLLVSALAIVLGFIGPRLGPVLVIFLLALMLIIVTTVESTVVSRKVGLEQSPLSLVDSSGSRNAQ